MFILKVIDLRKEFEIQGCVEVAADLSQEVFWNKFIGFLEANDWTFGGGINEIVDGFYNNSDGTKGKYVLNE